jgi:hypothetical protein
MRTRRIIYMALTALLALPVTALAVRPSEPLKCQRTIAREGSRFVQGQVRALWRCADDLVRDRLGPDPGPGARLAFCASEPRTAARIARAAARLRTKIDRACGGPDRLCGTSDDNLDMQLHVGFPSACPNLENGAAPDCSKAIADCGDVADCVACIHGTAMDRVMTTSYEDLIDTVARSPDPGERALNACQRTIGKETGKFLMAQEAALRKCWDLRLRGRHANICPDASAPVGSAARRAALAIARAESRKVAKICRACGGPGRRCETAIGPVSGDGRADDLLPAAIGFTTECPAVEVPLPRAVGGPLTSCGGAVSTLADLVRCVDCIAEFEGDCMALAQVPQFLAYPAQCNTMAFVVGEGLPHFLCHDVRRVPHDDVEGLHVEDPIGTATVTLHERKRFCLPADKNGEDPTAPARPYRLTGYRVTQEAPRCAELHGVIVTDQLGSMVLNVLAPEMFLVPSVEAAAGSPLPSPIGVDHFECYEVANAQRHVDGIAVADAFGAVTADVKRPLRLCVAANKNGEGVLRPDAHLMCYEVRAEPPRPDPGALLSVVNQLGAFDLDVRRTIELCLPATVALPGS